MMYSVWDHSRRRYDYFETAELVRDTSVGKPGHIRSHKLGATPEETSWPLPSNATWSGSGKYPKGKISSRKSGLGLFGIDTTPTNMLLIGALAYFAWDRWGKRS